MTAEEIIERAEARQKRLFDRTDEIALFNQEKVLSAFRQEQIAMRHFMQTNGYGYGDEGRDALGRVFARCCGAEGAIVSPAILSGTHAISIALFGVLRPNERALCITGAPYDTLRGVIGGEGVGSLKDFGINFDIIELNGGGKIDTDKVVTALETNDYKMVYIQRSRGYELRDAFSVEEIGAVCALVRKCGFQGCIFVDNCYGEFVEEREPSDAGADMVAGSLIKNPGGGLAPIGGYIAGRKDLIESCGYRLTSPGLGKEVGASLGVMQSFYQGLFLAPTVVASALKGAVLAANSYEKLGFKVVPDGTESRHDIIQAVELGTPEGVIAFCKGIQAAAPVDSYVTPEPWAMPGYDSDVIMAAGAFVQGSSIELSADGPIKPPFAVYFQGGLTWPHAKLGILKSLEYLVREGLVKL